jgi:tryptophan synthase alpha subunit
MQGNMNERYLKMRSTPRVLAITSKPACIGFGIANAESAKRVAQIAAGVIVGCVLVAQIREATGAVDAAKNFHRIARRAGSLKRTC